MYADVNKKQNKTKQLIINRFLGRSVIFWMISNVFYIQDQL